MEQTDARKELGQCSQAVKDVCELTDTHVNMSACTLKVLLLYVVV